MGNKLRGLIAVASLLIFGMTWSAAESGWVAAGVVAVYWTAILIVRAWRGWS